MGRKSSLRSGFSPPLPKVLFSKYKRKKDHSNMSVDLMDQDDGNTITSSFSPSKKDKVGKYRNFTITFNNYGSQDVSDLTDFVEKNCTKYLLAYEVGESGTPHIQGFMCFKSQRSFSAVTKWRGYSERLKRAHIEVMRGSVKQNIKYCSKEDNIFCVSDGLLKEAPAKSKFQQMVIKRCMKRYKDVKWRDWQQEIVDLLKTEPDERSIYWYWEPEGRVGKSFLSKYLVLTLPGVILCEGKTADVFNQVLQSMQNEILPEVIILDVPKTSSGYINLSCLEKLKNGCIYSGKYEGGTCVFPNPHVIVFANVEPNYDAMSRDRWKIRRID